MDQSTGGGRPPRKELQGPRPAPLKVRKESHRIKKPLLAPPPTAVQHQQPPRQPVIIYTVSPKVIHTNPSEFMTLVQRLTGTDSTSSSLSSLSSSSSTTTTFTSSGAMSPAAVFASIEKTKMPPEAGDVEGAERTVFFPGILSPGPGSLPQISPNIFSSFFHDPGSTNANLHHDLSAVQHADNRNYIEGSHVPSPFSTNNFMVSPSTMFSPSSLDLLHHIMNS